MKRQAVFFGAASAIGLVAGSGLAQAQITITASDMFNQVGQYYRAYANATDFNVSGRLGSTGGPQAWDFTTGPQELIYRFDYLAPSAAPDIELFPGATFVERKTVESTGATAFMYLDQVAGKGRMNYGFYDPEFSSTFPASPFVPPINDFPATIGYQDTWSVSTVFETEIVVIDPDPEEGGGFGIPARITYTASAVADAYGILNQPGIGFGECLRVNELTQYDIAVDIMGDGNYQSIDVQFVRNFYFLRKGYGIAVQVTSRQQATPPPDNFALAAGVVRMFETNHGQGGNEEVQIKDFRITLGKDSALLQWTKAAGIATYRVDYSTDLAAAGGGWRELQTTTSNFVVDGAVKESPTRFYRVVGLR
ncbi:MAG: hypothetical protein IPM17_13245 [Verrucomicrobia bacterium]|nr:hypothetical protein [Verrucomicrobiota bacterium]